MNRTRVAACLCGVVSAMLLAACGGGNNSDATISGSLTGLAPGTSVSLVDNGADTLTLSANGNFSFSNTVGSQSGYNVTVATQPTGQTCVVANGSGTIDFSGDSIGNVAVTCTANTPIGVSVTGLPAGGSVAVHLTLQNDSVTPADNFNVTATANDVTYQFATLLPLGEVYSVSVTAQPAGEACTVAEPSGGVTSAAPIVVGISCAAVP